MNDVIKHKIKHNAHRALVSVKWVIFAILVGGIVGLCGTAFYFCLTFVTVLRGQNPWLLYLLPVGGLIIVGAYHLLRDTKFYTFFFVASKVFYCNITHNLLI